jgi:hypothetical protein
MKIDTILKNIVGDYGLSASNRYQISVLPNQNLGEAIGVIGSLTPISYESNGGVFNGPSGNGLKLSYLADEVNIPGYSVATGDFKGSVPGINLKYAHSKQYNELNITFMMDSNHLPFKFMNSWVDYIFPRNPIGSEAESNQTIYYKTRYYDDYCADMIIDKLEAYNPQVKRLSQPQIMGLTSRETYHAVSRVRLTNVFPYVMSNISVSNGPNQPLKFQTTFYYEYLTVEEPGPDAFIAEVLENLF